MELNRADMKIHHDIYYIMIGIININNLNLKKICEDCLKNINIKLLCN